MAKSIDELYDEVKDYDIVITNDAALATALNGRIDVPRIGGFAYTPRHIAGNEAVSIFGSGLLGDLKIISEISNETGYSFKHIHSEMENIRNIRRYKKDVRKYLYSRSSKMIYDSFIGLRTMEKLMDSYVPDDRGFFKGKRVAVIGIELFDDLDKHFIPIRHDEIDMFKTGDYKMDVVYEIGNDRQIAENIVSLIDPDAADDVAIILDTSGPIADAVRAALYRRRISFRNTLSVRDLSQVRDYLQFLSLSLSYDTLRVRHVRELFSGYGGYFDKREDEYFVHKIEDHLSPRTKELVDVMRNVRDVSFQDVCDIVVKDMHKPQIRILIDDMRLKDAKISFRSVNELAYAVNNIDDLHHNEEIPDDEKKGVLLADCLKSVYVDRPFIIFLGLGPEWSKTIIGKEYIDREAEAELNMFRFTVLLQQGSSRLYAVNSMKNGKESCPCPIFEQIIEYDLPSDENMPTVSGFEDISGSVIKGQWKLPEEKETMSMGEERPDPMEKKDWRFSKSTYNNYFACPRAYMFGKIISVPDSEYTIFGNIIHEFAEFYLCYPELISGKMDEYTKLIEERFSGLSSQQMKDIDSSRIRVCISNIIRFVDSLGIKNVPLDRDYSNRKRRNIFMDMNNCEKYSSIMETEFISRTHPLFGNFDLIFNGRIIDYKTGKASEAADIGKRMDVSIKQDYFEFQPLIYLSLLKDNSSPPYRFSLIYVADNDVRSVTDEDFRVTENIRDIRLLEEDMASFLSDPDSPVRYRFPKKYQEIVSNWSLFISKALGSGIEDHHSWKDDVGLISDIMIGMGMKDTKTNQDTVSKALGKISDIINSGIFIEGQTVNVMSDTLERFLSIVDRDHERASEQVYSDFPAEPKRECSKCDFFKACTRDVVDAQEAEDLE